MEDSRAYPPKLLLEVLKKTGIYICPSLRLRSATRSKTWLRGSEHNHQPRSPKEGGINQHSSGGAHPLSPSSGGVPSHRTGIDKPQSPPPRNRNRPTLIKVQRKREIYFNFQDSPEWKDTMGRNLKHNDLGLRSSRRKFGSRNLGSRARGKIDRCDGGVNIRRRT